MVQNRKLISIGGNTSEKLTKRFEDEKPKVSFAEWVTEYLQVNLEKDDFLRTYAPNLHKIGITDNILYLKDSKKNKVIEIRMSNGNLESNDDDPIYLQFAWALPELAKLKAKS